MSGEVKNVGKSRFSSLFLVQRLAKIFRRRLGSDPNDFVVSSKESRSLSFKS